MVCVDIDISANETEYMQLPHIHIFHIHPISPHDLRIDNRIKVQVLLYLHFYPDLPI
jgi:hypothetical protein